VYFPYPRVDRVEPPHQVLEVLLADVDGAAWRAWPAYGAVLEPLIAEQEPVAHPKQELEAVCTLPAEQEQGAFLERIELILILYDLGKAVDPLPEIDIPGRDDHAVDPKDVI